MHARQMMTPVHTTSSIRQHLFHNDRIVLILFAAYGFAGGTVAYGWRISSDSGNIFSMLYLPMNIPVMLILAFFEISVGNPLGRLGSLDPVLLIPVYMVLWLVIGSAVYGLVRMLRLGSGPARDPFQYSNSKA